MKNILYENGIFWVFSGKNDYTVYKSTYTHSVCDSAYDKTDDGLSIAIARCNYLATKETEKENMK